MTVPIKIRRVWDSLLNLFRDEDRGVVFFPTYRLVWAMVLVAFFSCGLIFLPGLWLLPLVAVGFLGALAGRDYLFLRDSLRQVSLGVEAPSLVIRGQAIPLVVTVGNDTPVPLTVSLRPVLPEEGLPSYAERTLLVQAGATASVTVSVGSSLRGDHRFGPVYLRLTGLLGLMRVQARHGSDRICKVYPDINRVKDYIIARRMRHLAAPHVRTARLRGIGSEFESLRDYEPGDDVRHIDWKATAKHANLITRNYEIEHHRNIMVVIDRGRLMSGRVDSGTKLDYAVDAALMLCGVAVDSGDHCGVLVYDDDVSLHIAPQPGVRQLQLVTEALYNVQPEVVESHFRRAFARLQTRLSKRSLIIVLSDVLDVATSRATLHALLTLSRRHLVVFAALQTPEVAAAVAGAESEPYRRAVAYRLMDERSQVISRLQKGGVHVLDVAPLELTVPLVNKYIELREGNLL